MVLSAGLFLLKPSETFSLISAGVICGPLGFEKGDHDPGFPDGGGGACGHGQIEEVSQELQAFGTDEFEMRFCPNSLLSLASKILVNQFFYT